MNEAARDGDVTSNEGVSPRLRVFVLVCSFLAVLKLWLIRRDEIPCLGSPFDDIWYLQSANDWYWLRAYNELPFGTPPYVRLPAYPLYLAVVNLTGIPLRIINELLFIFGAFVFAWVLIKAGQSRALGILLFTVIVFHPASFIVNNLAYPDTFYASVLLFCLAGLILLLLKRDDPYRRWYALGTGIALALLWHIRQENIIISGFFACYALIWYLHVRSERQSRRNKLRQFMVLVAAPFAVIILVSLVVKTVNYARFGVFSGDAMFTSDFEAASKSLMRITPKVPIRFVAVPHEVRQRAYEISPAFKELEFYFEGDLGRTWASYAKDAGVQVPGEISTGHIWWGLNQATYYAGYNKSARQAGRFYRRIASEINIACDDGRITCRNVISSLVDPASQNYLPYLGESFLHIVRLFNTSTEPTKPQEHSNLPPDLLNLVNSVTNRRAAWSDFSAVETQHPESRIQRRIWHFHGKAITVLTFVGIFGLLVLIASYRRVDLKQPVFGILALLFVVVAIRVAVFTFIDASWWVVNDVRYVFPVTYLYSCFLLILIWSAVKLVGSSPSFGRIWQRIIPRRIPRIAPDESA